MLFLDEFFIAQHMKSMDHLAFEEAQMMSLAESDEERLAVEEIFAKKRKKIDDLTLKNKQDQLKKLAALLNGYT